MKKYLCLLWLFLFLNKNDVKAQFIGENSVEASQLSSWKPYNKAEYVGKYKLGFSESESVLSILYNNGKYSAKLISSEWNDYTSHWKDVVNYLTNVKIIGDRFYSDQFSAKFVLIEFDDNSENSLIDSTRKVDLYGKSSNYKTGIQILKKWNGLGYLEIGLKQ